MRSFVRQRARFYSEREGPERIESWRVCGQLVDGVAKNPYSARFGILDLYWLARLLRAELSSIGVVTYARLVLDFAARGEGTAGRRIVRRCHGDRGGRADPARGVRLRERPGSERGGRSPATSANMRWRARRFPKWPRETMIWRRGVRRGACRARPPEDRRGFRTSAAFAPEPALAPTKTGRGWAGPGACARASTSRT